MQPTLSMKLLMDHATYENLSNPPPPPIALHSLGSVGRQYGHEFGDRVRAGHERPWYLWGLSVEEEEVPYEGLAQGNVKAILGKPTEVQLASQLVVFHHHFWLPVVYSLVTKRKEMADIQQEGTNPGFPQTKLVSIAKCFFFFFTVHNVLRLVCTCEYTPVWCGSVSSFRGTSCWKKESSSTQRHSRMYVSTIHY